MDITRLPNDKKLQLCRWYFKGILQVGRKGTYKSKSTSVSHKTTAEKKRRKKLDIGCVFLPFVWAVNAMWFFKEAFMKPPFDEQKQIKKYVVMSGLGAIVWAIGLVSWALVFQARRVAWGATGEALSFVLPLGRA